MAKEDEQKVWKTVKSSINMKCRSATYNERKFWKKHYRINFINYQKTENYESYSFKLRRTGNIANKDARSIHLCFCRLLKLSRAKSMRLIVDQNCIVSVSASEHF